MRKGFRVIGCVRLVLILSAIGGSVFTLAWASAPVTLELRIADLERQGLQARGINALLVHRGDRLDVRVHVDQLVVPGLEQALSDLDFSCPGSERPWPGLSCKSATLNLAQSPWGAQKLQLDVDWTSATNWQLTFSGLRYAGDRLQGRLEWSDDNWMLTARSRHLHLEKVRELQVQRKDWGLDSLSGRLAGRVELRGKGTRVEKASVAGRLSNLAYADAAGEQAAEKLAAQLRISGSRKADSWFGSADISLRQGEVYSDPVFVDIGKQPLHLVAQGQWKGRMVHFSHLEVDGGRVLRVKANGSLDTETPTIRDGQVRVDSDDLGSLYQQLLQPLLVGTGFDDLEVAGDAGFRLQWKKGVLTALDGAIDRIDLDHRAGSFGANGLKAQLFWRREGTTPDSRVSFEGGHLGKVGFGEAKLQFNASGQYAWLRQPVSIPFYSGHIRLSDLSWVQSRLGPDVGFSISIGGVSLEELSRDLGWPRMQGKVASEIPRARFRQGSLVVDGDLLINAFDGRVRIQKLQLDELGSAAPVLQADAELRRLDLSRLTQAFSFGEIQGRLDGDITGVQLVGWQPNRFDARFYSSPEDDLQHRISQRAVENLTELGNGVSGALSASFLRFFEEFSYDRIELRIRQQGDNAWIDGIPASDGGYYLVKGAGIPRIDVIGRNRRVGWKDLLARLKSIRVEGVQLQ